METTKTTEEEKKQDLHFRVSFDPTSANSVEIVLPNGKVVSSKKKEVMKHVTRAVINACLDNNMPKKAASLRPFMKDEIPSSPKQQKVREVFLGTPSAKRAKKEVRALARSVDKGMTINEKKNVWSKEEDEAILNHAAKFDDGKVDWSLLTLEGRKIKQFGNRYRNLTCKKGDWSKEEDEAILKYAEKDGDDTDWSSFVLPGRITRQFRNRYKNLRVHKDTIKKGGWTKEEDEAILKYGQQKGTETDWFKIELPNRTAKQCSNRFQKLSLKNEGPIKKGEWTSEEDKQILEHGKSVGDKEWLSLAQKLPGRIPNQCRRRFKRLTKIKGNYVKVDGSKEKEENMTTWTAEEDRAIKDHVQKHGECKWKLLAKQLPGRKGVDCKKRWFKSDVTMVEVEEAKDDGEHSDLKSDVVMVEGDEVSKDVGKDFEMVN